MSTPFDDMDLSPVPSRPNTLTAEETPCQRLERTSGAIKRFTTTKDKYKLILDFLEKEGSNNIEDPFYVKIPKEHHEMTNLFDSGGSDFSSISRCSAVGCPIHSSQANTPLHTAKITPPSTSKSTTKRKEDELQLPLSRKTARRVLLETPQYIDLNLGKPI
ncbi:hypothetical protein TNCT_204841 [Trichonephila clavata]|uniref:Uncharacterized protein n=1 Tax=Trichonephila clavata TaxID=2740835 RepID=A0A8X6HEK8_TRICU|nr:hypothetical protein TNCT_204841 [Trichonephila clavata]